jgi:hypothetical protein
LECSALSGPASPARKREVAFVSHANNTGYLQVTVEPDTDSPTPKAGTTYEDLEQAITSGSLGLPIDSVLDGVTLSERLPRFRIMGCAIGGVPKFLLAMKAALGGAYTVTAPNHIDFFAHAPELEGWFEFLQYEFEYTTNYNPEPKSAPGRPNVLEAFQKMSATALQSLNNGVTAGIAPAWLTWHALQNKVPISDEMWNQLIPKNLITKNLGFTAQFREQLGGQTEGYDKRFAQFRHIIKDTGPFRCPGGAARVGAAESDRRAFVASCVSSDPRFSASADVPYYQRYGFRSFDEFMGGHNWFALGYTPRQEKLVKVPDPNLWFGFRRSYAIRFPIYDIAGKLIYNFVGNHEAYMHLDARLDDPLFFTSV